VDTAVVSIKQGTESIYVASVYLPGDESIVPSEKVKEVIEKKQRYIMGLDANAHNEIWGSTDTNDRGECLLDFIIEKEVEICNRGNEPTYVFANGIREEVLDITICSKGLGDLVKNWKVWKIDSFSDHRYISFRLTLKAECRQPSRNPKRTKWEDFKKEVKLCLTPHHRPISNVRELDTEVEGLTHALVTSYEKTCPLPKKPRKQNPPWWTKEIAESVRVVRRLKSKHKKLVIDSPEAVRLLEEYKNRKKQLGYMIRKSKRESWKSYCESIDSANEASRLRKILAKESSPPGYLKKNDGTWTESSEEIANILMDAHFPESREEEQDTSDAVPPQGAASDVIGKIVTEKGIRWAVNSFQPYKSP